MRLQQHRQDRRLVLSPLRDLRSMRQAPHTDIHRQQGEPGEGWEVLHAALLKPRTRHDHRHQKPDRAPQTHTAIQPNVELPPRAHQVRHRRLGHGHHGTGVDEHQQQHHHDPGHALVPGQAQRHHERHPRTPTHETHPVTGVVAQPAPDIGREGAGERLCRQHQTDQPHRQAQVFQPQREVRIEKPDVRKVAGRQRGKRNELSCRRTRLSAHALSDQRAQRWGRREASHCHTARDAATHAP